jgi:hypothetical protein
MRISSRMLVCRTRVVLLHALSFFDDVVKKETHHHPPERRPLSCSTPTGMMALTTLRPSPPCRILTGVCQDADPDRMVPAMMAENPPTENNPCVRQPPRQSPQQHQHQHMTGRLAATIMGTHAQMCSRGNSWRTQPYPESRRAMSTTRVLTLRGLCCCCLLVLLGCAGLTSSSCGD